MKLSITSPLPIRYQHADVVALCQSFGVTHLSNSISGDEVRLEIAETLNSQQIEQIRQGLIQHILANLVSVSVL